jgi:uncharacterized protein YgbK (DUF1537 family)
MKQQILLAFYGDDFTGSTDALEFLSRAGARTVLFIDPPSQEKLAAYPGIHAFGIAGITRSVSPEYMEKLLRPAFTQLSGMAIRHVHYKVCSTFDSSPETGSIGKAIDIGMEVFGNPFIPLLVSAPALGRYVVFGNLFARMGTAREGKIYRLDRHPSMIDHPVTPADESDLRLHLSKQTKKKTGLVDILQVKSSLAEIKKGMAEQAQKGNEVIVFDALSEDDLHQIGTCLDEVAEEKTLFSVGSSGVEMALGAHWNNTGVLKPTTDWPAVQAAQPLLVLSGSRSPVTTEQISHALKHGFREVILQVMALVSGKSWEEIMAPVVQEAAVLLQEGIHVIIHTGRETTEDQSIGISPMALGKTLGSIARSLADKTGVKRIVVAGGDTSSYAARAMGIESVEMIAPVVPGAPLCRATAPGSPVHGLEVNFKGGQVGGVNYFVQMANCSENIISTEDQIIFQQAE